MCHPPVGKVDASLSSSLAQPQDWQDALTCRKACSSQRLIALCDSTCSPGPDNLDVASRKGFGAAQVFLEDEKAHSDHLDLLLRPEAEGGRIAVVDTS